VETWSETRMVASRASRDLTPVAWEVTAMDPAELPARCVDGSSWPLYSREARTPRW